MAVKLIQGFNVRAAEPIDVRVTLTKAEMLAINPNIMPDQYFALCKDDNRIYVYLKNAEATSETTGKFFPYEDYIDLPGAITKSMSSEAGKAAIEEAVSTTLPGAMAKTLADETRGEELVNAMFDSTQFVKNVDNKIQFQVDQAIQCIEAIDGMA